MPLNSTLETILRSDAANVAANWQRDYALTELTAAQFYYSFQFWMALFAANFYCHFRGTSLWWIMIIAKINCSHRGPRKVSGKRYQKICTIFGFLFFSFFKIKLQLRSCVCCAVIPHILFHLWMYASRYWDDDECEICRHETPAHAHTVPISQLVSDDSMKYNHRQRAAEKTKTETKTKRERNCSPIRE